MPPLFESLPSWLRRLLKPAVSDIPESAENTDVLKHTMDAHPLQAEMTPNLRAGHITGSGGSVKSAEDTLTPEQRANVERFRGTPQNMGESIADFYSNSALAAPLRGFNMINRPALSNPFTGGIWGGGLSLAAASGIIGAKNLMAGHPVSEPARKRQMWQKILATAGGVGAGVLLSQPMAKTSSFGELAAIRIKILSDNSLSPMEQAQMLELVRQLDPAKAFDLKQLLATVSGAGVGAAVMRFLFGTGVLGTIGGGLAGALLGSRLGAGASGMLNNSVDFFGRPF